MPADLNLTQVFPWSRQKLLVEPAPVRVSRMADLPPEADAERKGWISHLITLNAAHQECEWPDAFLPRL